MPEFYELPYKSRTFYTGNGVQKDFPVTFAGGSPLDRGHVQVFLNQVSYTSNWSIVTINGQDYVRFVDAPPQPNDGVPNVMLKRVTPGNESDRVVDFTDGSILSAADLDKAQLNSLYVSQESADLFLDQGGAAVNVNYDQTIGGEKTFTGVVEIAQSGSFVHKPQTPISKVAQGKQYVLAAATVDGAVEWMPTTVAADGLPANVVLTDTPAASNQVITGPKRFENTLQVLNGNLKVDAQNTVNKALVANDNAGTMTLQPVVNGVRLGSANAAVSTGTVTISPESIGALPANLSGGATQTVSVPINFTASIGLGDDASADTLTINSSLVIPPSAEAGKVLTCLGPAGNATWAPAPQTGITSINGDTGVGGSVTLDAADVGAASLNGAPQTINAQTSFSNHVTLGDNELDNITVLGRLKYPVTGYAAGKVLFCQPDGEAVWNNLPASVTSVNGKNGAGNSGAVTLTAADVGAVGVSGNQSIADTKTFTGTVSANNAEVTNQLTYNVGTNLQGKVLTSDASGRASWASPPATGVTSINNQTGPAVTLTAADVGAVSVGTAQEVTGAKTFSNNVNLGVDQFDIITVNGELRIPGGTNGQVLTQTAAGKAIWQTPEPAGVTSVNGGNGAVTITAADLGAYTAQTIPTATTGQKGLMQVGSGLSVNASGVVSVNQNATLPQATADTLGGIKVGSGLSISGAGVLSATLNGNVGVNKFNNRVGDVVPESGDYTAAQVTNAVTTNSAQDVSGSKKFTANQTVSTATPAVGTNGSSGVLLNTSGLVQVQRTSANDRVFQGHAPAGGVTSYIEADGDATFSGVVTANGGFVTTAGMTVGDNTQDGINITGTLKIGGNGSAGVGKVLTCTNADGNTEWQMPANAPVTSVNGMTGVVSVSLDGEASPTGNLNGVTKGTNQTISGQKTFTATTNFNGNVNLGDAAGDVIKVDGTLRIPSGAVAGRFLQSDASGNASWAAVPTAPVSSVNGATGAITIIADGTETATTKSLGAVDKTSNQTIGGNKTFSGTVTFNNNVTVGATTASSLTVNSTPVFPTGASAGRVLTCTDTNGNTQWSDPSAPPVTSVNGRTGAVVITADDAGTGIGAVTKSTAQDITGTKTFTVAQNFHGDVKLGDAIGDTVTLNAKMLVPADKGANKVLTCVDAATGQVGWAAPRVNSVRGSAIALANAQTGDVSISAADVGAPTIAALNTVSTAASNAQTTANTANANASNAQATANSKLSAVSHTVTALGPAGSETNYTCLSGDGTAGNPLKVEQAAPCGPAAGDLSGAYPNPTIGANKVTFAKMQLVPPAKLLGGPTTGVNNGQVQAIGLGAGLTFDGSGNLSNSAIPTVSASGNNTFSGTNTFTGNVQVGSALGATNSTTIHGPLTANGNVTIGDAATDALVVKSAVKIESGSPSAGKVLTCDGSGNATWENPATTTLLSSSNTWTSSNTFNSTLTANGALTANGNTTLGNEASDVIIAQGVLKIKKLGTNPAVGNVLVCVNADGTTEWQSPMTYVGATQCFVMNSSAGLNTPATISGQPSSTFSTGTGYARSPRSATGTWTGTWRYYIASGTGLGENIGTVVITPSSCTYTAVAGLKPTDLSTGNVSFMLARTS
jgi:hypothetical protein